MSKNMHNTFIINLLFKRKYTKQYTFEQLNTTIQICKYTNMQIYKYANIQIYEHNDARKEILVIYDHKVHLLVTNTATYLNS